MPIEVGKSRLLRVKLYDRIATVVVTLGGLLVVAGVIAVILMLTSVALPLFHRSRAELRLRSPLPAGLQAPDILALGVDLVEIGPHAHGDALSAYTLQRDGTFTFFSFPTADPPSPANTPPEEPQPAVLGRQEVPSSPDHAQLRAVEQSTGSEFTLLWSDGSVSLVQAVAQPQFDSLGRRHTTYELRLRARLPAEKNAHIVRAVARADDDGSATAAQLTADNRILLRRQSVVSSLFGDTQTQTTRLVIDERLPGAVSAMTLNRKGDTLFVGTSNGYLARWRFDSSGHITAHESVALPNDAAVTALAMVFGDISLAVGDATGQVTTWAPIRDAHQRQHLRLVHTLSRRPGPVRAILPSQRNKSLLSLGSDGVARLDYMTSQRQLLTLAAGRPLSILGYSPRGNAVIGLQRDHRLAVWRIHSPHPEISWRTLFAKVWYDGHDRPEFIWQSSGTDEPKFSLVPVIFGTLKATLYAMLFAVPLALASALYVSHFTTPAWKRAVKPVVEVMAAVPTVVVGFLILLWAAPLLGQWIVALLAGLLIIPLTFVLFMLAWQFLRRFPWAKPIENGYEFLLLVPVLGLAALLAIWAAGPLEQILFQGDFRQWLFDTTGSRYDPLNSLVVALGLGFAVVPIIFSLSEDALSQIPHSLAAASLALGASRWQTAWRVILPSAAPGVFAAVMIGFARAVGETMIVFMATGNTPILDWSPFNGFRTLSANIAVEISEAPRDGTLYRVLFLCAVILFLFTFVLNTAAELVRARLQKKFGRY